jgi:hypothetical protein
MYLKFFTGLTIKVNFVFLSVVLQIVHSNLHIIRSNIISSVVQVLHSKELFVNISWSTIQFSLFCKLSGNEIYDYEDMEFHDYYSSPASIRLVNTGAVPTVIVVFNQSFKPLNKRQGLVLLFFNAKCSSFNSKVTEFSD